MCYFLTVTLMLDLLHILLRRGDGRVIYKDASTELNVHFNDHFKCLHFMARFRI